MNIQRNDYEKLTNDLINISKLASKEIMKIYKSDFKFSTKEDNSPVTIADEIANKIIVEFLETKYNGISVISEENREKKIQTPDFFLVDPLDGTKEFIKKNGEFTVNIAFMKNFKPCLGVIYIPAKNICYFSNGKESFKINKNNKLKKICCDKNPLNTNIVASRSHIDHKTAKIIEKEKNNITKVGSSIKFCLIAEGIANFYFRYGNTMEWDIAAGHAILKTANGKVTDEKFNEISYGKENFKNGSFIAYSSASTKQLKDFLLY